MKISRRTLFPLILILYVGFILGLLYLQFFAKSYSHTVGDLRITGHFAAFPLVGERKIRDLVISYNGLELHFGRSAAGPAAPDAPQVLQVEYWKSLTEGGEIIFQKGLRLKILRDGGTPASFVISPVPGAEPSSAVWKIPFRVAGDLRPTEGRTPILSWERGRRTFYLSLPGGSRVDTAASVLLVRIEEKPGGRDLHLSAADGSDASAYAYWLSQEASLPSEEEYRAAVTGFLDNAWRGWSATRLSADGTLWTAQDGKAVFQEEIGTAFVAESLARNSYPWARNVLAAGWNAWRYRSPAEFPEAGASAFLGNLADFTRRAQARDPGELARLGALVGAADPALFATPRLIVYLLNHGPFNLVQETLSFLRERAAASPMGVELSVGALEACLDAMEYVDGDFASKGRNVVDRRLLPAVRKTDLGIFLAQEGEAEKVDVLASLRGGALLLRAGDAWNLPVLRSIGRGLLTSAVSLKGEAGFLPTALTVSAKNERVTAREGSLAPETAYPHVALDRRVPREIPLSRSFEPGVWIWGAAALVSAENAGGQSRFVLSFPPGNAHYLMIQGIKPFQSLRLHDTIWRSDPAFGQYPDGWVYDAGTLTLFLKVTHRLEKEEILIQY